MMPSVFFLFKQLQLVFIGDLVGEATPLRRAWSRGLTVVIVVEPVIKALHSVLEKVV